MADLRDHPTSVRAGEELDLIRLEPFLRSHFPEATGSLSVAQFPSGHSNLTYLVSLGDRQMVLRRPPFGSKVKTAHDMSREYQVLSKLQLIYPQAPKALLYCEDASVLGCHFYPMERVQGIILRRDPPEGLGNNAETARQLSEAFVDNLARLHGLDYSTIGLADLEKPQGYLDRQVEGWIARYHGSRTHDLHEVGRISDWLNERRPREAPYTLIHNDYKYDNVVLDPTDITRIGGVLDWEMCTVGDPLSDLGTALAYWVDPEDSEELQNIRWGPTTVPGTLTRTEFVRRYAQTTGRDVSSIVFYRVLALFKVTVIIQQIYYRYHQGLTRDVALPLCRTNHGSLASRHAVSRGWFALIDV
jgi:aminoglycoside phosphotransferase (APT) family kinase protein